MIPVGWRRYRCHDPSLQCCLNREISRARFAQFDRSFSNCHETIFGVAKSMMDFQSVIFRTDWKSVLRQIPEIRSGQILTADLSGSGTMQSPQNIRVHKEQRELELVWTDSDISRLSFRTVRQNCRCAVCVDEFSGKQLLDPESVPVDLGLLEVSLCGNYALRIRWSDNHDSGLFTWNHLRSIGDKSAVG